MTDVITEQTPPILHGPSDKERKYDRQLRLWAASGQAALEEANILLLNSGAGTVGVETLKNLVLPGIGKFTIADDAVVSEPDLGVNFFLDEESLGTSRAQSCTKFLEELNPDVKGDWYEGDQADLLTKDAAAAPFTLILYTYPITAKLHELVKSYEAEHKIPTISIHSVGFYSSFRISIPGAFPIVDTHPDTTATTDLRLLSPWPELVAFARELTTGLEEDMAAHERGHVPYVALLLYHLERWRVAHDGKPPVSYAEKVAFRKTVAESARTGGAEGGEENYEEAVAAVLKTVVQPSLSSAVREVFDYVPSTIEARSSFWAIAAAVKQFHAKHNELPLPGSVPDMKAQSSVYVRLQSIYKAKARRDAQEVLETVRASGALRGNVDVSTQEVETFCKNAAFIKLVNGAHAGGPVDLNALADAELNAEFSPFPTLLPVYLAMKATEHDDFPPPPSPSTSSPPPPSSSSSSSSRTASSSSSTVDIIMARVAATAPKAAGDERVRRAAAEVARARAGELHNVSALTGGMVAQEAIKVITKQYVPVENTCVFDGIASRTQVFKT